MDTWASTLAGHTELASFLDLGPTLGDEEEPSTWGAIVGGLGPVRSRAARQRPPGLGRARRNICSGREAQSLGFDPQPGESERTPTLARHAHQRARRVRTGSDDTKRGGASIRRRSSRGREQDRPSPPTSKGAVLGIVARTLNRPGDYEKVLARYRSPSDPQQEMRSLTALAAFHDADLCLATFDLAVNEVRTQNAPYLVASLLRNAVGGPAVWNRLTEAVVRTSGQASPTTATRE